MLESRYVYAKNGQVIQQQHPVTSVTQKMWIKWQTQAFLCYKYKTQITAEAEGSSTFYLHYLLCTTTLPAKKLGHVLSGKVVLFKNISGSENTE